VLDVKLPTEQELDNTSILPEVRPNCGIENGFTGLSLVLQKV